MSVSSQDLSRFRRMDSSDGPSKRALIATAEILQRALVWEIEQYLIVDGEAPEDLMELLSLSARFVPLRLNLTEQLERAKSRGRVMVHEEATAQGLWVAAGSRRKERTTD